MNVEEKEQLIKKDIISIENKVRSAFNQGYEMGLKELKAYKEQSGDAISRQAMHIELEKWITYGEYKYSNATKYLYDRIDRLPSVTPQQRTGRWIERFDEIGKWYECDRCHTDWGGPVNFCPNCGAKMEVSGCTKNI